MKIHYLQHVPFEGLGSMAESLLKKHHTLTRTCLFDNEALPPIDHVDWLIVMGGPMGVMDEDRYPFLKQEKQWIREFIQSGKRVLGICLGAQLIAHVLGAEVKKNPHREIGWFPLTPSPELKKTQYGSVFPDSVEAFHWHGDTFDIPQNAIPIGSSAACKNQGFVVDNRVVGLQFHLETTPESARSLIEHCPEDLDGSNYVQSESMIFEDPKRFERINTVMEKLISVMEKSGD